ncbi:threonine aldolase 1 [Esox lucius]|uniref:Aromatic amino acid beta-eliminating lyase/threonine aldolase domain-containing protein n=2 Tax=Esox lucius TaxID=8010 RepID=A0A3P9AFU7_ESOLU|nr:threonine aldolase 1 [Esox lucius]
MFFKTFTDSARGLLQLVNRRAIIPQHPHVYSVGLGQEGPSRLYYETAKPVNTPVSDASIRTVDLRSDTVTKPGAAMRQAMAEAEVGDDVFGEDPTVNELQKMAAELFGMEAALYVPSGTMANLIAVMVHCRERGDEMIVGDLSHLHIYEQGGTAQLAGVHSTTVTTLPDGTFDLDQLESKIRHGYPDAHYPRSRLVCVENTHNIQGGRVLPLPFLKEVKALAEKYGLAVHMDGARMMNAAVAQNVTPSTILQNTHSVSVCLSKGLGAPVGTMLAGPHDFISRATRCRKALGGGLRQAGILAAAGKLALGDMITRLEEDHHHARIFAQALLECDPPLYEVDMAAVQTNIVRFRLRDPSLTPTEFCTLMAGVGECEQASIGQGVRVLMFPHIGGSIRAVWHLGVTLEDTQLATRKVQFVARQHSQQTLGAH